MYLKYLNLILKLAYYIGSNWKACVVE